VVAFNYGTEPWTAPFADTPILGGTKVAPRRYTVWRIAVKRGLATAEPTSGGGRRLHRIRWLGSSRLPGDAAARAFLMPTIASPIRSP